MLYELFWWNPYLDDWIIFTGIFLLFLQGVFHIVMKNIVGFGCFFWCVCFFVCFVLFSIILLPFPLLEFLTKFQTKWIFCCSATWRVYLASWFFCWEWGLCWLYRKYYSSFGLCGLYQKYSWLLLNAMEMAGVHAF